MCWWEYKCWFLLLYILVCAGDEIYFAFPESESEGEAEIVAELCNCPKCIAARAAAMQQAVSPVTYFLFDFLFILVIRTTSVLTEIMFPTRLPQLQLRFQLHHTTARLSNKENSNTFGLGSMCSICALSTYCPPLRWLSVRFNG